MWIGGKGMHFLWGKGNELLITSNRQITVFPHFHRKGLPAELYTVFPQPWSGSFHTWHKLWRKRGKSRRKQVFGAYEELRDR